ncbi:cyclin-D3-2 [Pyrus ussuriensis x Pyrus communis]|uniref:Cyclin-D3-2 n=1 Tax=Pyrus ussuriensis x Pyrus communis TaxID=2448454 RepID=A0A5N5I0A9_9ROSA|nr:cyclin-D3-2 [Pyrus ussuriensis x Pyrus communis]
MALQEEPQELQNPPMAAILYYSAKKDLRKIWETMVVRRRARTVMIFQKKQSSFPLIFLESDMFWENNELSSLISKEEQTHVCFSGEISYGSLMAARTEVVEWILSVEGTPWLLLFDRHSG